MSLRINIPQYTGKDIPILISTMLPLSVILNYITWDSTYFNRFSYFLPATIVTFLFLSVAFIVYGAVAISFRERFPLDHQLPTRLAIVIPVFILMSAVYISLLLRAYEFTGFLGYRFSETDFNKCFLALVIANVFLTFLNEGVYRFERYKATVRETEQLKKEYLHSQLLGLKSQMNPHFLFNSLNTLSCLIHENADQAEEFLDHMSKVYRYLLRNHEEQLVALHTELSFTRSYYYLLKSRHNEGLHLKIDARDDEGFMIPPLTLQMILENALTENTASRDHPLFVHIRLENAWLVITNSVQPKISNATDSQALENIANKFRLLCQQDISVDIAGSERIIKLPLIRVQEEVL
ncbi:MAG TPA: histidine kinase, partial [Flavisolibacter sp.]